MPLEEILPADRNPKQHADLNASFEEFGYLDASVLDERTGQLIGGHGRIEKLVERRAAGAPAPEGIVVREDGVWLAPVQRGWSSRDDLHAEAAGIALNRYTELGGWNDGLLQSMLDEIGKSDLLTTVGFTIEDFDDLSSLVQEAGRDPGDTTNEVSTPADRLDGYAAAGIRSIILPMAAADYDELVRALTRLRSIWGLATNSDAVLRVTREAVNALS